MSVCSVSIIYVAIISVPISAVPISVMPYWEVEQTRLWPYTKSFYNKTLYF